MQPGVRNWVRILVAASCLGVIASMGWLIAMRRGVTAYEPQLFAKAAGAVIALAFTALVVSLVRRAWVAALFTAGILLVYGGGMANFLFSLQGYTLLTEFEHVQISEGRELQEFAAGPLSNVSEMDLRLQLERLELGMRDGGIYPSSRIRIVRRGEKARTVSVARGKAAVDGQLLFMQGAYGFAPRIVITRDGNAVFDRHVPFTTRRIEGKGIAFEETFEIASEKLRVRSALDVQSVDDEMKGHARLGVVVTQQGKELGRGELMIGHFAKLSNGLYIGYAGLKRWSEIDIARRSYPEPIYAGTGLVLLSAIAFPFTRRRG